MRLIFAVLFTLAVTLPAQAQSCRTVCKEAYNGDGYVCTTTC